MSHYITHTTVTTVAKYDQYISGGKLNSHLYSTHQWSIQIRIVLGDGGYHRTGYITLRAHLHLATAMSLRSRSQSLTKRFPSYVAVTRCNSTTID